MCDGLITVSCGVVVVNEKGEFLTLRRVEGRRANLLSVPGGKPKFGEKAYFTAVREVYEEVGLLTIPKMILSDSYIFHVNEWIIPENETHHYTFFLCSTIFDGEMSNREPHKHKDLRFITLEQAQGISYQEDVANIPLIKMMAYREKMGL